MIEEGTVVAVVEGGIVKEMYCQGEARQYVVVDYDDDAIDKIRVYESETDTFVPNEVVQDIEIARARLDERIKHQVLMLHLRALVSASPMVDMGTGWSSCGLCGKQINRASDASDIANHSDDCTWAKAKKAVNDANM
jgi:hypothetical protein